jgi:CheY-like chemotaxis protein
MMPLARELTPTRGGSMALRKQHAVRDEDVYALTPAGEAQIRGAATTLPAFALELLVRVDGHSSVADVGTGLPDVPHEDLADAIELLLHTGLIARAKRVDSGMLEFEGPSSLSAPLVPSAAAMKKVAGEAGAGVTSLQRQGFYVRIARRPAGRPQLPSDRKPLAVIIEDEPQLAKFLMHFLGLEGFDARIAGTRDEIIATLRQPPRPDLVLLDVMLPDADGFDVLMKMREHDAFREVPIIMLTAKTTREAVIKGLAAGADGYITKPFQTDILVQAIKTVFGISHGAHGV